MRHRRFSFALILLACYGTLAWGFCGCITNPETGQVEVHWPSVAQELSLAAQDLRDAAQLAEPQTAQTLTDLAAIADEAAALVTDGPPTGDALEMLDRALLRVDDAWNAVSGEQAPSDVRVAVLLLRTTLRRARAYGVGS